MNQIARVFDPHEANQEFEPSSNADGIRVLTPIGQAVEILGLTPRAMRHYEEMGLIWAERNAVNGRCYDARSLRRLDLIRQYRACGLSLAAIRDILDAEDRGPSPRSLERAQEKLTSRLRQIDLERSLIAEGLERIHEALGGGPTAGDTRRYG